MLTMRSFMIGTLLVATVWANEEPTSRCEAWGYESENELECYGSIREMVDDPSHACWAEQDSITMNERLQAALAQEQSQFRAAGTCIGRSAVGPPRGACRAAVGMHMQGRPMARRQSAVAHGC